MRQGVAVIRPAAAFTQPVDSFGRFGSRTRTQRTPCRPTDCCTTGSTSVAPVNGAFRSTAPRTRAEAEGAARTVAS